jgi:hypothetical protein
MLIIENVIKKSWYKLIRYSILNSRKNIVKVETVIINIDQTL